MPLTLINFIICLFFSFVLDNDVHKLQNKTDAKETQHKEAASQKVFSDSTKEGAISANDLVSSHPTVNQSFIDKIVSEIEAKHPIIGPLLEYKAPATSSVDSAKLKSHTSNALQQLIDNVADSVVKEVTEEFTGKGHKPRRRVTVPKALHHKDKPKGQMPLLNDHLSEQLDVNTPGSVKSATKTLDRGGKQEPPPEMVSSDEIIGHASPVLAPENPDVKPSSITTPLQESLVYPHSHSRGNYRDPERPGLEAMRELLKSKSRLKSIVRLTQKRPMTQRGKKKLTIPATTEGKNNYK